MCTPSYVWHSRTSVSGQFVQNSAWFSVLFSYTVSCQAQQAFASPIYLDCLEVFGLAFGRCLWLWRDENFSLPLLAFFRHLELPSCHSNHYVGNRLTITSVSVPKGTACVLTVNVLLLGQLFSVCWGGEVVCLGVAICSSFLKV